MLSRIVNSNLLATYSAQVEISSPIDLQGVQPEAKNMMYVWHYIWGQHHNMTTKLASVHLPSLTLQVENVEHCGSEPEQADTASLLANQNAWVCQEKAFVSSV